MKRNLDLVRDILRHMEAQEHGFSGRIQIDGYSDDQVGYHIYLMKQAGLLEAEKNTTVLDKSPSALPLNLTWDGHDFLDASRSESTWAKAKEKVIGVVEGVTFGVLLEWLKAEAKRQIGLPP